MQSERRQRPRWVFRGRAGAWDTLMAAIAKDPTLPAQWPIAPSGPSMSDGDAVLLWRSGRGGGIAALCTVVGEPEARPRPDGPPEVTIGLRIERALGRPIEPLTLLQDPTLRSLAFMDLFDTTEHRVDPAQEEALAALLMEHEGPDAGTDAEHDPHRAVGETRITIDVPARLVPMVRQLLASLGADDPPPVTAAPHRSEQADGLTSRHETAHAISDHTISATDPTSSAPTDTQVAQAEELARRHGSELFTVDEAASTWRTGVGTARSRVERLIDSGLLQRAGTLRPVERPGEGPTRGRPPVLYRLNAESTAGARSRP